MFDWLKVKNTKPDIPQVLYFKDNISAFQFCCKFLITDFIENTSYACIVDQIIPTSKGDFFYTLIFPDKILPRRVSTFASDVENLKQGDLVLYFFERIKTDNINIPMAIGYISTKIKPEYHVKCGWKLEDDSGVVETSE